MPHLGRRLDAWKELDDPREELVEHHRAVEHLEDGPGVVAFEKDEGARREAEFPPGARRAGRSAAGDLIQIKPGWRRRRYVD
jgi:hypothetical protein